MPSPDFVDQLRALLPPTRVERLDNGLMVCLADNAQAPVVSTALVYRAGCRDDPPEHGGAAHFLEHMMWKGGPGFAAGEIDRLTRRHGGTNNAFTSHDATVYTFAFARERWRLALEIEVARMTGLDLDPAEVTTERRVILEEIAMYEDEPWDALEQAVLAARFPAHPYGRPVLGTRDSLARTDGAVLGVFHQRYYRPPGAVLALVGALGEGALEAVQEAFAQYGTAGGGRAGVGTGPGAGDAGDELPERAPLPPDPGVDGVTRVRRRHGEVPRFLLALPSPPADTPEHARLQLLLAVLGSGRSSRLHRALVDRDQLCVWVSCDLQETVAAGTAMIAAELVPEADPERVEAVVRDELATLVRRPPDDEELARVRRMHFADWVFGHERVHQQAMVVAQALALYDDLEQPYREWRWILTAERDDLRDAAARFLRLENGAVVGWSLPRGEAA